MRALSGWSRGNWVVIAVAILLPVSGCQRAQIPPYSDTEEIKFRADEAKDLANPQGDLAFIKGSRLAAGIVTFGRAPDNKFPLEHWGAEPLQLKITEKGASAINSPKDATYIGKPVTAGMLIPPWDSGPPPWIRSGEVSVILYKASSGLALQIYDAKSEPLQQLHAANWYPPAAQYRVDAEWIPLPQGYPLRMPRVHGGSEIKEKADGFIQFSMDGKPLKLYGAVESAPGWKSRLFIVFRDPTSKTDTYPSGRFLEIDFTSRAFDPAHKFDPKKKTRMALDFNQASNPACAYNPNTDCPIAPAENRLPLPIPAGEKRYHSST